MSKCLIYLIRTYDSVGGDAQMKLTLTAKIKIKPSVEQINLLQTTCNAYHRGCNFVSALVFDTKVLSLPKVHKMTYTENG